eukprot:maker-scaffold2286_size17589-snap-gene-0.3 protein:Tk10564 transcript:maker-scaffold2286_size17589-snap-gene-0.3-mRNA-1 annotation:"PREDICTED: sialin-like"
MSEKGEQLKIAKVKLCGSTRLQLALLCASGVFLLFVMRFSFSLSLVCMTGTKKTNSTLDPYEAEFDWDRSLQTNMIGALFYGYLLTQVLGGWFADRFGGKLALMWSMLGVGILNLMIPEAARYDERLVLAARFLQGFLQGCVFPTFQSIVPRWCSPNEKSLMMALILSGCVLSNVVTNPIGGLLCSTGFDGGWPMVFYVPGVLTLFWCAMFHWLASNDPEDHRRISKEEREYLKQYSCKSQCQSNTGTLPPVPWVRMLTSPAFLALIFTHVVSQSGYYFMALSLPLYINEVFQLGIIENGIVSGLPFIGPVFLGPLTGILLGKLLKANILSLTAIRKLFTCGGLLTWASLMCLLGNVDNRILQIVLISLANCVHQVKVTGGFYISHSDLVGPFAGVAFGITNTIAQLSGFVIPMLLAHFAPNGTPEEWRIIFYIIATGQVMGAIIYAILGKAELQSWAMSKKEQNQDSPSVKIGT